MCDVFRRLLQQIQLEGQVDERRMRLEVLHYSCIINHLFYISQCLQLLGVLEGVFEVVRDISPIDWAKSAAGNSWSLLIWYLYFIESGVNKQFGVTCNCEGLMASELTVSV